MKTKSLLAPVLSVIAALVVTAAAQPTTFTYQGHLTSSGTNFNGAGQFKFALVTGTNTARQATATATLSGQFVTSYTVTDGGNGYTTAPAVTITGGGGSGATAHTTINNGAVNSVVPDQAGSGYTSTPTVNIAPPTANIVYTTYWNNDSTSADEPLAAVNVAVSNGNFRVVLGDTTVANMSAIDASIFAQPNLQLRIWFSDGVSPFVLLDPPQLLTPTPYSVRSLTSSNVVGPVQTSQLNGTIDNNQLTHNFITVTAGTGLSGGGSVALGGTTTFDNTGVTALSANNGITVSSANGSVTVGSTATSSNNPSTLVSRDTNGDFASHTLNLSGNLTLPQTTAANGVIFSAGVPLLHSYASNFFVGPNAGNLTIQGRENTGVGFHAMPSLVNAIMNTACGAGALSNDMYGSYNTAVGNGTLRALQGNDGNTAVGSQALFNEAGSGNTGVGAFALFADNSGLYNTALGYNSLGNVSGSYNTGCGINAGGGINPSTGFTNTSVGYSALWKVTSGGGNIAVGALALGTDTTGSLNIGIGDNAGAVTSGNNNIFIGNSAGSAISTGSGNIDIGNSGYGDESNTIRIGTSQTRAVMLGIYGTTIVSGGTAMYVNPSGLLGTATSSARFKTNIQDMASTSDALLKLRPVTFNYKKDIDPDANPQFGLIAEEVEKVNPNLIVRDPQGRPYSVRYEAVNAMLLNEFLKEHHKVEEQSEKINELEKNLSEIKATLARVASHLK